ncbi:MAG: PolC-type DNA polymerase III [Peptococcaceae bacterium]|nr:PolC-type DNA polymerase III [Peptococcaceae bacterium]
MSPSPWAQLVAQAGLEIGLASRLGALSIKNITVSQAENAWEISFANNFPVTKEDRAQVLALLQSAFGSSYDYRLEFEEREETPDVKALLEETLNGSRQAAEIISLEEEEELMNRRHLEKLAQTEGKRKEGPRLILGRKISGEPTPLSEVLEERRNLIVKGMAFRINDMRQLKAGTLLYDFDFTDFSGSIKVKLFLDPGKQKRFSEDWLKPEGWYLMRGSAKFDQYTRELTFFPDDVMETECRRRKDEAPVKRVELHLHTKLSAMDAVSTPESLIRQAIAWGHEAVAITDHGVVQAFPDAMKLAKVKGDQLPPIKIIYGMEGYLIEGDGKAYLDEVKRPKKGTRGQKEELTEGELLERAERTGSWHIILLAKNKTGIKNLYELVSLSHLDFFYKKPRIPREAIQRFREGLIIGSACEAGELFQKVLNGEPEEALEKTAEFYDYLEIQPVMNNAYLMRNGRVKSVEELQELNRRILNLGRRMGKPVCATCDVHFLNPEDEVYRRILQAGQGYKDADQQPPLFFRTTEEMLKEFEYLGEEEAYRVVVEATREIAAQVEYLNPIPNQLMTPKIEGAEDTVKGMAITKAHDVYGQTLPELIQKRLDRELNAIISAGYAVLYLIAHKLVKHSNDAGYMVGSRGSVGSSVVAFFTDITEVNPLPPHYLCRKCKYVEFGDESRYGCGADMPDKLCPHCGEKLYKDGFNIPFEVFLGFEGDKVPDIDLNFSGEYQTQAQKYTEELFGAKNVFKAGTISTVAEKTAFGFVKRYFAEAGIPVRDSEVDRLAQGCSGVKRTTGQHPGGIVVLPKGDEITNYTPVQHPADDVNSEFVTTHFDYHAIDSCLVKLDILGHDDPTMIRLLEDMTGIDVHTIPLDEPKVLSLFQSPEALGLSREGTGIETGSIGLPEFGTGFVRGMLLDTLPKNFADLVRISGFSHGTDVWLGNAKDILKAGLGTMKDVIAARDDIMLYLIQKGVAPKHAFKIMEQVRKGKGLKPEDISAMEEAGVPDWYIGSCQKIKYMFPKAHAVAYVTSAFRIAWFKVYRPLAYYAATFSVRSGGMDGNIAIGGLARVESAMAEIRGKRENKEATAKDEDLYTNLESVREMLLRGYDFLPVNLEKSSESRYLIEGEALRLPFTALPGLGLSVAQAIVEGRKEKPYLSCEDLKKRGKVGKSMLEVLRAHGALGNLPESDQQTLF